MPPRDPKDPRTLTTVGGVKVIVNPQPDPPAPEPQRAPEPAEKGPRVIIVPEGLSDKELRAWLDTLARENKKVVDELLARREDVLKESRKDLRQRVLVILCDHVEKKRAVPQYLRAWLDDVIHKVVRNHKDVKRLEIEDGADADAVPAGSEKEPESAADRAARRARVAACVRHLPRDEAAVIRCIELFDVTIEEAAVALRKPPSTVHDLAWRAAEKLAKLVRALPAEGHGRGGKKNEGR